MKTTCPKCNSENTQSFEMAHRSGTTSGFMVGTGVTGGGDAGLGAGINRQKSGIAKLTEPPKTEGGAGESVVLIIGLLIIFNFVSIAAVYLIAFVFNQDIGNLSVWLPGLLIGAVASLAFGVIVWKQTTGTKARNEAAYKVAMMKWKQSWICLKCGNTFYIRG